MPVWEPKKDINNNGFRPMKFTATGVAIARGALCAFTGGGAGTVNLLAADTTAFAGIAIEAIDASSTEAWLYTDGIFYASDGAGGTTALNHWVMYGDTNQVITCTTGKAVVGLALLAAAADDAPMRMLISSTVMSSDAHKMA